MDIRQTFLRHVAQTSTAPVGLHIKAASGHYLYDASGKAYLDLIGGISVCNLGHGRKEIIAAVTAQAARYMHVMVYGELIQSPQTDYAALLTTHLPDKLNCVYFTNSGAEAVEGALKLAKRVTGRTDIIAANKSYHGSTSGALSIIGDEYWRNAYRPLLPGVRHYDYNTMALPDAINNQTACVVLETVQAEAGIITPDKAWLEAVRRKCTETGALLILDEIQCGFGRTGNLWGFTQFGVIPDILLLGKALGGGMPLGAFVADYTLMQLLTHNPVLGHITTFGGHPVCCAAGKTALELLLKEDITASVAAKQQLFLELLQHPAISAVRSNGLLIAIEMASPELVVRTLEKCLELGVFADWFLFAPHCIRIAPPLTITEEAIRQGCAILLQGIDSALESA